MVLLFFTFLVGLCFISLLGSALRPKGGKTPFRLPPGPIGLPVIGHLHMLGDLPHRSLQKLAKKYGPIMYIRLGLVPTIVVSSPVAAELFLKTHDLVFASRPTLRASDYLSYGHKSLIFAPYGSYWRKVRKICTLELLTSLKIEMFKSMRRQEVLYFVESMKTAADSGSGVDVSGKVGSLVEDMTYRMIFGSKDDMSNLKSSIREAASLIGKFNVGDYISYLGALDFQGYDRRLKDVSKVIDGFFEKIIDAHMRDFNNIQAKQRDFMDVMLSLMHSNDRQEHLERDHIKAILLDVYGAGMDTSAAVIGWTLTELLKNPRVMKLVQEELEKTVGLNRMVEEYDLNKLDYLKMVVKESMRLHPVGPLLIPHESMEDITINGYFIPRKSRIFINTWAIGHDPKVWSKNVEEFNPERFIDSNLDVQGHDFRFIPFGSGRRKCPGLQLGMTIVELVVAQIVHCFNLELPNGMSPSDLDMSEEFGMTVPRANPLIVTPKYRLFI